ncbi:LeoA/HP0731 family dynamin-like GTPase [Achromobacter aegrifaciens]|uniref:LeoA/HP0731 family dynamin-like GTPase n=1 Tax=Achromobacter aegrifaciens TaxID=1287736 RepID=UPI001465164B|nr:LeoA/HP0731 family dynamin-like GTPase [Achromobacter aegrifaciens]CAB3624669.1 hypothetical protein LMG26852_00094 [Achromobacter aegrifaciens]
MEKTLDAFKKGQTRATAILRDLVSFLHQGENAGVPIAADLKTKLQRTIEDVDGGSLRVALIGGFSEGKTSIAAAWLEKLDKSSMKISQQESSNEVNIYEAGPIVLIDTPGLFGFKEQVNAETRELEKYKDITKKYVSEAHLVLYVMDSTNPIKASHQDDLTWLFRTLNLLPRTVFVLSRFDMVADVADESEFQENFEIKRENVSKRLRELIDLTPEEQSELSIVAVAANPFDLGVEHWLSNAEEFRSLSHIGLLQQATADKVESNGGPQAIVSATRRSIIRDVLNKELPVAIQNDERIREEMDKLEGISRQMQEELQDARRQMSDARIRLRSFVTDYFASLIRRVSGVGMEGFGEFFEKEIGTDGVIIAARLQNEFERQLESATMEIGRIAVGFESEIEHYETTMMSLGKQGMDFVLKGKLINNGNILLARDGLVNVAKFVGVDLAKMLKFKPWGAVNLAKGLNGVLAAATLAIEVWDTIKQANKADEFKKIVESLVSDFTQQRVELLKVINGDDFETRFFQSYVDLNKAVDVVFGSVAEGRERQVKFQEWRRQAEAIDAEFRMLEG